MNILTVYVRTSAMLYLKIHRSITNVGEQQNVSIVTGQTMK